MKNVFDIKKDEFRPLFILSFQYFCIVSMGITSSSFRDASFLTYFEKTYLPLMYVAIAVVLSAFIPLYNRIAKKINTINLVSLSSILLGMTFVPFTFVLKGWVIPAFYIWVEIITVLCVTQFWLLTGMIFNARQAKRLLGIISSGGAVASIIIGFGMGSFIDSFGSNSLLYLSAFFLFATAGCVFLIKPYVVMPVQRSTTERLKSSKKRDNDSRSYLVMIGVIICSLALVSKIVDYQFKMTTAAAYPSNEDLLSFFGTFYAITGITSFIVQFFFTSSILLKFGVVGGLLALPIFLTVGSASFLLLPMFLTIFIPKFTDQVLKFTINNTTLQLLWLPIPQMMKMAAKPTIDGPVKSLAEGMAGLCIFLTANWLPLQFLSIFVLAIAGIWMVSAFAIKKGYVRFLERAIEKRQLNFEELEIDITDNAMVDTIEKSLRDSDEVKRLVTLDFIRNIPLTPWEKTLNELYHKDSKKVANMVLQIGGSSGEIISDQELLDALQDPSLAGTAISKVRERNLTSSIPTLDNYLKSQNIDLRLKAAEALLLLDPEKTPVLHRLFHEILNVGDPQIQTVSISLLENHTEILNDETLEKFLRTPSENIRKSALIVAGSRKNPYHIPAIVSNLADPKTLLDARQTLKQFPDDLVIQELLRKLQDKETDRKLLRGIITVMKDYRTEETVFSLIGLLERDEKKMYGNITDTFLLMARRNTLSEVQINRLLPQKINILRRVYEFYGFLNKTQKIDSGHLLNEIIRDEIARKLPALLKLSVINAPATPIEYYIQILMNRDVRQMPLVIEVLDNLFSSKERELITPIIENVPVPQLSEIGSKRFNITAVSLEDNLRIMLTGYEECNAAIALDFVLKHGLSQLINSVDWDNIRPTFFLNEVLSKHRSKYGFDGKFERFKLSKESLNMYSTIERIILLKTIPLFQSVPVKFLSTVAQIAEEKQFLSNEKIFSIGTPGDCLYMILDGMVKIHTASKDIDRLTRGACLGEMAILDGEPRSADATAETETTLLKIDREDFYEIMNSNPDILYEIIKLLTGRLRKAMA